MLLLILLLLLPLLSSSTFLPHLPPPTPPQKALCIVGVTAGIATGGATAVLGTPFAVGALGFSSAGIVAGSPAATLMAALGPTPAGGFVATLQSVGAGGFSTAAYTLLASIGSSIVGIPAAISDFCEVYSKIECHKK
jgi:hypothetical protein